jgi:hypothetical protein
MLGLLIRRWKGANYNAHCYAAWLVRASTATSLKSIYGMPTSCISNLGQCIDLVPERSYLLLQHS